MGAHRGLPRKSINVKTKEKYQDARGGSLMIAGRASALKLVKEQTAQGQNMKRLHVILSPVSAPSSYVLPIERSTKKNS